MPIESEKEGLEELKPEVIKEEPGFQYFLYLVILFTIYLSSFLVPTIIFMGYVLFFFLPNFLEVKTLISIFTELNPLIALLTMPLIMIICYLLRLFFIALITRFIWRYTEKKFPSKNGIIPRNISSKAFKFYHIRSFLIKYPKNFVIKGIFPWLVNFLYNFVGSSKIGKGTTLEESVSNEKFIEVGENCYIGVNSALASHAVEGIFGNISYFEVNLENNVTTGAMNIIGPGSEVHSNSYLLPLASTPKHSVIKGNNYYWGLPLRKIFRKKIMDYLKISSKDIEKSENIEDYINNKAERYEKKSEVQPQIEKETNISEKDSIDINKLTKNDLRIDFTTSSAISRVNIKFLAVYLPIIWLSGLLVGIAFYTYIFFISNWALIIFFLPAMILILWFIFILGCFLLSKLFFILINLIHKPKEGIFIAEIGDTDFEFWKLRTELRKLVLWLMRNSIIPWMDVLAFRWFGIKMDFSSALYDAWCDGEFISFGRKVLVGQGATVMSSMVVGKYLIIKKVIFDDYALIGGHATIAPGTIIGNDGIIGAISTTTYDQILEPGWIYFGIPAIKLKENKYAEERRDIIVKKDVDAAKKFELAQKVNID